MENTEQRGEILPLFSAAPAMGFSYDGDLNPMIEYIKSLEYQQEINGNAKTVDRYVHKLEGLKHLEKFFLDSVHEYARVICNTNHEATIQQSWVNVNCPGVEQPSHWHSNSWLSGVFYLASDSQDGSPITFHNYMKNFAYYFSSPSDKFDKEKNRFYKDESIPEPQYNPYTSGSCDIASIPGNLIIFSSLQPHGVSVNETKKNRISISFNTFPKVPFGDDTQLNRVNPFYESTD